MALCCSAGHRQAVWPAVNHL